MPSPDVVRELVKRFEENLDSYRSGRYNETQLRREFLDPLFEALGWDVFNKAGYAEAYKDVIHEDSLEVEGALKAPDYAFRIGGGRKFFVEAKKPSVKIETDVHPAFQLRRYSWSAKLPLGILTDFEEFAVYDCRSKPDKGDKASAGRVAFYKYTDYVGKWDEIAETFSREAVLKGAFDKYAEGVKGKKGTAEVDDAFLAEIERWRELLAKNFALRNPSLTTRELNYAVQMTIDRIIFLRICEDRGIEPYGRLKELVGTPTALAGTSPKSEADLGEAGRGSVYAELCRLFQQADARYNSGLFHFKEEKEASSAADSLTLSLTVDDKVLRDILGSLYYPESPYVFSEIPSDILGQVYERFLGKVIRLTAGHQAKVEEKPEVRKAGGVYYTPTYIVEYIVRNTVGKLLEGKTPKDAAKLTILDPACGSGTFPLGTFQYLLDWHLKWYTENDPVKWAKGREPRIYQTPTALDPLPASPKYDGRDAGQGGSISSSYLSQRDASQGEVPRRGGGGWRLTTAEKKRILLNNIYGVDIDPQAVEVTKLSLLLKVLEGESEQTIGSQLALIQERALPDLGRNIKCGNSLIGPDYYDPAAGRGKGHQLTMGFADAEERYRVNAFDWKAEFPHIFIGGGFDVVIGNPPYGADLTLEQKEYIRRKYEVKDIDTYAQFIERALHLCKIDGLISMIVPTGWYSGAYFSVLRRFFSSSSNPIVFVNLPYDIFKAWVDTTIFVSRKLGKRLEWPRKSPSETTLITFPKRYQIRNFQDFENKEKYVDISKWFENESDEYLTYANFEAMQIIQKVEKKSRHLSEFADVQRGVTPFHLHDEPKYVTSKRAFNGTVRRYSVEIGLQAYIRYDETLAEYKPERYFVGERLLIRELISRQFRLQAVKVGEDFVTNKSMQSILVTDNSIGLNYLLGIINSRLLSWYFLSKSNVGQRDDFPKIVLKETRSLPICTINFSDPTDKARHDVMVQLVEGMLELHKMLKEAKSPRDKEYLERNIKARDREIDKLVYALYGLSEEEIKIVEGTG